MKPTFEPVSEEILNDRNGCNTQMKIHWKINKKSSQTCGVSRLKNGQFSRSFSRKSLIEKKALLELTYYISSNLKHKYRIFFPLAYNKDSLNYKIESESEICAIYFIVLYCHYDFKLLISSYFRFVNLDSKGWSIQTGH